MWCGGFVLAGDSFNTEGICDNGENEGDNKWDNITSTRDFDELCDNNVEFEDGILLLVLTILKGLLLLLLL